MTGFQYDQGALDVGPRDAREDFYKRSGIRLAHFFGGSSLVDQFGGVVLAPLSTPSFDHDVADTLDGSPLLTDPPSKLWSHAYRFTATGQAYNASSPSSVAFGTDSAMVAVTLRFGPQASIADICGNRDMAPADGIEVRYDGGNFGVRVVAQPFGQAAAIADLAGALDNSQWHTIVAIADRVNGRLRVGTIDGEVDVALAGGSLASSRPFSIGKGRGLALFADTMHVVVGFGDQVAGRSPKLIAQAIARATYWDADYARISSPAR